MKLEIVGKNYDPSDSLIKITTKKCAKLERRLKKFEEDSALTEQDSVLVRFVVTRENEQYRTVATITAKGLTFRAEETSDSPFDNVDIVIPRLDGQLRKQKDIWGKTKKGTPNVYAEDEDE